MRPRTAIGFGLLLAVALGLAGTAGWVLGGAGAAAPPPTPPAGPVSVVDGLAVVNLQPSVQRASGLQEQAVGPAAAGSTGPAVFGVILDLRPLVDWRGKYEAAQAREQAARAQWATATAERDRLRALHDDGQDASLKSVQAAQAEAERARSSAQEATASVRTLQADALQQFGPVLAAWAQARSAPLQRLLAHRSSLVALALGSDAPPATLPVTAGDGTHRTATWVGPSVRSDPRLGAGLQVYLVPGALPADASVTGWLPGPAAGAGVFVPRSAVVWYADQPWAYVRRDASHFARVPLLQATETPDGYVARGGIAPGASVVTQGAGLLLSQEQTPPPNAAPCKDPECDD
ncbi:MAG: hypothetical protein KGL68_05140 [Burkholderiales bacterium]|nr:hypothetical protein [Burkholderiales bacterium]